MNYVAKEIISGKNLEINLPKFGTKLMSTFNSYSFIRFAMNYYTYFEMVTESLDKDITLKELTDKFNSVIMNGVLSPVMGEAQIDVLNKTEEIRNKVIEIMKGLTSLADVFNIYEYVLNRTEYNFKETGDILIEKDDDFVNSIMAYILSDKDNVVMNTRICEVVRELPVRMTKTRFFELLHSGLMIYKDSEKQSIDDFIYMLKSSSMLDIDENALKLSKDIEEIYREFSTTDFSVINEGKYNDLAAKLSIATSFIEDMVNKYMMFAELVNDVYVIVLSNHYVLDTPYEHKACIKIIETLYNRFSSEAPLEDDIELEDYFFALEGKQEEYHRSFSGDLSALEAAIENHSENISALALESMFNSLNVIRQLESGSIFIEFNSVKNTDSADIDYIDSRYNALKGEYEEFFKSHIKLVNRAVMAHVLSALPIFFNNVDEIKQYVSNSLMQCSDKAEKTACFEIFHSLMEE